MGLSLLLLGGFAFWLSQSNKQKQRYNKILEEEVNKRTLELAETNLELQESNQELERFAYIASHDLKEPLRNISSFSALLQRKISKHLTDETRNYLDFIIMGAKQMNSLIVDVLEFSRLSEGQIDKQLIDTNEVVHNVIKAIEKTLEEKNATVILSTLPPISADSIKMYSVFKNLIENGVKYNENPKPSIEVTYEDRKDDYLFKISDNGIGIDKEYQNSIFEMFKRLHNRSEYEGTGIGLAFVQKVIKQHGGKIWVESNDGEGSTFKFTIPKPLETLPTDSHA